MDEAIIGVSAGWLSRKPIKWGINTPILVIF
jgi:hypothetical protein